MIDLPLDQVRTLLVVADEGTFEAAARALHVTQSAVSQRIKALEQRVGRVLVQRSRPVRLTDSGMVLLRYGRQLAQLERDARSALGADEPAQLSIAVNADSLGTWFLSALSAVAERFPVGFDLHREDQDHTAELLRQGRVLAAVTSSPEPVQGCRVRPLGRLRYHPMASPAFVARWLSGRPLAEAFADAPVVDFDRKDLLQTRLLSKVAPGWGSGVRHYVPATEAFTEAVVRGLGWGMIDDPQAAQLRADGVLVDVVAGQHQDVPLYWQQWKLDSPPLAALADAVARAAADALLP